jgi:hypothetical protein
MNRLGLLILMAGVPAAFCVACGGENAGPPQPVRQPTCGVIVPMSSISEAQKGEAMLKFGSIRDGLQAASISTKYNRDLNKLSGDINGKLDARKWAILGLNPASFDGTWYTSADFAIDYAGGGKFIITIGELNTPKYIREEVTIR